MHVTPKPEKHQGERVKVYRDGGGRSQCEEGVGVVGGVSKDRGGDSRSRLLP